MSLYEALAVEYKEIFPSSREKMEFLEKYLEKGHSRRILDMGCASGELVYQLASSGRKLTGIDLDSLMIAEAKKHSSNASDLNIQFYQADMLRFLSDSDAGLYDLISCLGNTVVYLADEAELKDFLIQANKALNKHGTMVIQILNYSNPGIVPGFTFPTVETDNLEFNREYVKLADSPKFGFKTAIKEKSTGETDTDLHRHYPFLSGRIAEIAIETGFSDTEIFGGYDGKDADASDFFHLLVLKK